MSRKPKGPLRRGWTTGACATAATKAALTALLAGDFPDPVTILLPKGQMPAFALDFTQRGDDFARAAIVKDAGDDPDVTHLATIVSTVSFCPGAAGVEFKAGPGVGTVTRAGLPLPVGEPAINPVPRQLMTEVCAALLSHYQVSGRVRIEISVPDGEALALKTWNPRLGIVGGLSILGTTGVVIPYSCSAWIHSIHRGIDVARANGTPHAAACTGSTSEATVKALYGLDDMACLDMGDFAGGVLKYLRRHPLPRLTIGGGFGKLCKLAQGHLDLHSGRSQMDFDWLAERLLELGASADLSAAARACASAGELLGLARAAGLPIGDAIAERARATALKALAGETAVDVVVIDRAGTIVGRADA